MSKAALLAARTAYDSLVRGAKAAEVRGEYAEAIAMAKRAWPHLPDMMKYEAKHESADFDSVPCIDLVLEYAPILLDYRSLDELGAMLKQQRRIESLTSANLADELGAARSRMDQVYRIWRHLEAQGEVELKTLGPLVGNLRGHGANVINAMLRCGVLRSRTAGGRTFVSLDLDLAQSVEARCVSCGSRNRAEKRRFLQDVVCAACGRKSWCTILGDRPASTGS